MKENVAVVWARDITKDDKTISTAVGSFMTVQSLTECVIFCGTTVNGAALFFRQNIGSCKCSDTQISPLHPLTPEIGVFYFVAQMCKVHGYVALMKDLCVKVFETQHSYDEAKEFCYKENGRLVRLDTFERIVMVRDYLVDVIGQSVTYNKVFYIDGRKSDSWRFSDGSEIKVFQWGPFEPSNFIVDECLCMFQEDYLQGDTLCNVTYNKVFYIEGRKSDSWRFSDGSEIKVFQWGPFEPSNFIVDECLCMFQEDYLQGDTLCNGVFEYI